jgi:glycosyltransferase involved in cell wall biosynthesis
MPTLSVCLIARDEEKNIERALRSVENLADEIVLTDTGSTDGTVEIARRWARVEYFAWIDDFSAARNYCIAQARGQWIFMIDADEELRAESRDELLSCLQCDRALAFTVLREDLVDLARPDLYTEMLHTQLFRNRPDLRFVGHIHHQFTPPLSEITAQTGLDVLHSTIRLRHFGYAGNAKGEKLKRAARYMEMDLRDRPGEFYYLVELGRTYVALGDARGEPLLVEAAEMVRRGDEEAKNGGGMLAALLEHVLACDKLPDGFPLSFSDASRLALELFPDSAPLLWQIARREFRCNRFDRCRRLLERVVALGKSGTYNRLVSFDPCIFGDDAQLNLGVCYTRLGQLARAEQCFQALLGSRKFATAARANLKQIRLLRHQQKTPPKRRSE